MYTQCSHCQAIFRVSMKEVTTAQGQLRCGECDYVFDAMDTLSSTLPNHIDSHVAHDEQMTPASTVSLSKLKKKENSSEKKRFFKRNGRGGKASLLIMLGSVLLGLLLAMQVLHSYRNWFAHQPLTAKITRTFCQLTGCKITPQRDPNNISIISRNVYAHPNETDALIISASLKNKSIYQQPLPLVEVSFLNKKGDTIALRRFRPESYLSERKNKLFNSEETITFKLKIEDPGSDAIRFKFRFL